MSKKPFKILIVSILLAFVMAFSWGCGLDLIPSTLPSNPSDSTQEVPSESPPTTVYCDVTVHFNNGEDNGSITVEKGKTFSAPNDPIKENYLFLGWYTSSKLQTKYDFSKPVNCDVDIYAGYEIDGKAITNAISTSKIKSVVKIYNYNYDKNLWGEKHGTTSQGSGFCFAIENNNYYFLTNCHVAFVNTSYTYHELIVEDYKGNQYQASIYNSAISASYDLACLVVSATETEFETLELCDSNPVAKDDLIVVGAPEGQTNCITFGEALSYKTINLAESEKEMSNVTFEVLETDAYANHGSSGCPVFDANLKICGVVFAGTEGTNKAYAVPVEKIKEFLTTYVYA